MRHGDTQLGFPFTEYTNTKAAIESLTGVPEGSIAYASDTNQFGSYNGASWTWGQGSGGHTIEDEGTPLTTRTKLNFVGGGITATDDSGDDASVVTVSTQTIGDLIEGSTNKSTPVDADRFGFWDSVADILKYATWANIKTTLKTYFDGLYTAISTTIPYSGWVADSNTWTRTGNFTFTLSGDHTARLKVGVKIRCKQGGGYLYGVILTSSYASSTTTITLITNSLFTLTATTITDTYYSYIEIPEDFPQYFDYIPTVGSAFTLGNGTATGRWTTTYRSIKWEAAFVLGSTSAVGSGNGTITNPCTLLSPLSSFYLGKGAAIDPGIQRYPLQVEVGTANAIIYAQDAASAAVRLLNFSSTVPFTWASGDSVVIVGEGYF